MTLGVADKQGDLFDNAGRFCAEVMNLPPFTGHLKSARTEKG